MAHTPRPRARHSKKQTQTNPQRSHRRGEIPPATRPSQGETEEQHKLSPSTRPQPKQPLGQPCRPGNGSSLRYPKGPRRSRRATRKRAGPARTPRPQRAGPDTRHQTVQSGGTRQTHKMRGAEGRSGAVRRSQRKRTAEREEGTQPPAPTARQARRKRTWAARCRGSRRRGQGAARTPQPSDTPGNTGGTGENLEESTSPDGGTDAKPHRGDPGSLRPGLRGSEFRSVREGPQSRGGGAGSGD